MVSILTRIKGNVSEQMVRNAVDKVQQRHTLLRVRIELDEEQTPWFTSEDVQEIPIEVISHINDDSWIEVYDKACKEPFDFDKRPAIRFYLLQSENISDILIFCHHVICDGMSLAYLARDLMVHLGDQNHEVEILPDPLPISREIIPEDQKLASIVMKVMDKINNKWEQEKVLFDQEDYLNLHDIYWKNFTHKTISIELSEEQTNEFVKNCKRENVSVNSALVTAFVGAQLVVQGKKPFHSKIGVGGDLRNRLTPPVGEGIGFYAGLVNPKFKYNLKKSFWDNARLFHSNVKKLYTNKNFFKDPLTFTALDPSIMEARNYKMLGGLVPSSSSRFGKISNFSIREDTALALLKRSKSDSIRNMIMGTAVTNLTRMNFPNKYGPLELDRLIMHPGGGLALPTVNLVIGAVTCANKLSLLLEYAEETIDTETVKKIEEIALKNLLMA